MASGAPLFPGESDIDQLFHIMRCFGQLPPKLLEVFRANPLFIGIKIPDNIQQTETLEERFPAYPADQLELMKDWYAPPCARLEAPPPPRLGRHATLCSSWSRVPPSLCTQLALRARPAQLVRAAHGAPVLH